MGVTLTGERLHEGSELFAADLARHRAAYRYALEHAVGREPVLDLGSGAGYGTAELAGALDTIVGLDRVSPDASSRRPNAHFLRARLEAIPLAPRSFGCITSFQVIEHLEDPGPYLRAIARLLRPDGIALITTPNLLTSDRANPFHVHEYRPDELAACLGAYFDQVDMKGVGATPAARSYHEARVARVRRMLRLDPLNLRSRLPGPVVELLFGLAARIVRLGMRRSSELPRIDWRDFPIGPGSDDCIDLLAVCRGPRAIG